MIFIKKLKLLLFICSLITYISSRSISITELEDIHVEKTEDKWICGEIECPLNAFRCYVTKSNLKTRSELVHSNICYSGDRKVLKEKVTTTPIDPNYHIDIEVISGFGYTRKDSTINYNNCTNSN